MKTLLTRPEVCELLRIGFDAEVKLRRDPDDPIPHLAAGRRLLYDREKVLRWAERQTKRPRARRRA